VVSWLESAAIPGLLVCPVLKFVDVLTNRFAVYIQDSVDVSLAMAVAVQNGDRLLSDHRKMV
jgi:hypothetical protein